MNVIKSAQDDKLLSANDVINLIFKMAPRLIKSVYMGFKFLFSGRSRGGGRGARSLILGRKRRNETREKASRGSKSK